MNLDVIFKKDSTIIKDNNIPIPALIDPDQDQIHKLVEYLIDYDDDLYVYDWSRVG